MKATYSFYYWLSPSRRMYAPWGVLVHLITAVTSAPRTGPWLGVGAQWRPVKRKRKYEEREGAKGETTLIRKQKQTLRSTLAVPLPPLNHVLLLLWQLEKCPCSSPTSFAPQGLWMPSLLNFSGTELLDLPGGPVANLSYQCRGPRKKEPAPELFYPLCHL